jgi:hypothetical protein
LELTRIVWHRRCWVGLGLKTQFTDEIVEDHPFDQKSPAARAIMQGRFFNIGMCELFLAQRAMIFAFLLQNTDSLLVRFGKNKGCAMLTDKITLVRREA